MSSNSPPGSELPLLPLPSPEEMTRAYRASDGSYDGVFYLGVRTTGIFCRPSCPARKPLPENVDFFASPKEALAAGYRACLRCRPLDADRAPEWLRGLLERLDRAPDDRWRAQDLRDLGLEPARVRRYFASRYGLTFQAYCRARRLGRAFDRIRGGRSIDQTVFDTGYESHSGFREAFENAFGQPPGRATDAECVRVTWIDTPLGSMAAAATDEGLCLLEYTDEDRLRRQVDALRRRFRCALVPGDHPHLTTARGELADYFSGRRVTFTVPLQPRGTDFEMRVWRALQEIPYGATRSYEDIARLVASPAAVRAVGRANGRNPLAIVIPCHRVVNKSGELGGYGGGLWRKRRLLHLEQLTLNQVTAEGSAASALP